MMLKRLMPLIVGVVALAGCASGPEKVVAKSTAAAGEQVFTEADAAIAAKQEEKAYAMLKAAGQAHPVDKRPWVRMAQIRFNAGMYGEAITNAQEALERDPDDAVAHSIVAVSGLRVASKALSDLTRKNNLQGDVKSEAQDLAKLLRTSIGEPDLFPKKNDTARPTPPRARATSTAANTPAASSKPASNDKDPFAGLK
ncbi:tetratricopeptide repeat protein [Massilia consociata]|uniref:Tetratricopeptide repeat protein n=1 Tax=Massilia consociata TaxID=760117 RepID=A0ABV6FLR6_9BURK